MARPRRAKAPTGSSKKAAKKRPVRKKATKKKAVRKTTKKKAVRKKATKKKTTRKKAVRKRTAKKKTRRSAKPAWPKKILDLIHECWESTATRKACLELLADKVPEMPPPAAWGIIRKLSKTDKRWILTARKKQREKEALKQARERRRAERAKRREARERKKEWRDRQDSFRKKLSAKHLEKIQKRIEAEFFFCPDTKQHVNNIACIFRVFSGDDWFGFSHSGPCARCKRMDKHLPEIEKAIRSRK
jgi:hypothetical protein